MVDRPGIGDTAPVRGLAVVVPSDSTILNCRGFYVGSAGNIAIVPFDGGAAVTLVAPALGVEHAIACQKIMATNTTAGSIVALF